jgi:hypothetical protein
VYKLQDSPDNEARLENGAIATPIATLKDEHGGVSHIIEDDHCYVLINNCGDEGSFRMSKHWYADAIDAVKQLPLPKPA